MLKSTPKILYRYVLRRSVFDVFDTVKCDNTFLSSVICSDNKCRCEVHSRNAVHSRAQLRPGDYGIHTRRPVPSRCQSSRYYYYAEISAMSSRSSCVSTLEAASPSPPDRKTNTYSTCEHGRREQVQDPVKNLFRAPQQGGPTLFYITKSETATFSCRVTWLGLQG